MHFVPAAAVSPIWTGSNDWKRGRIRVDNTSVILRP
jgi:hypothetical protein